MITSDERGGGVVPGGASCSPGVDNERGNGGLHFFPTQNFTTDPPRDAAGSQALYAKTGKGERAIYRTPINTPAPQGTFCTSTSSSRSRGRTGSSWAGTRRARR